MVISCNETVQFGRLREQHKRNLPPLRRWTQARPPLLPEPCSRSPAPAAARSLSGRRQPPPPAPRPGAWRGHGTWVSLSARRTASFREGHEGGWGQGAPIPSVGQLRAHADPRGEDERQPDALGRPQLSLGGPRGQASTPSWGRGRRLCSKGALAAASPELRGQQPAPSGRVSPLLPAAGLRSLLFTLEAALKATAAAFLRNPSLPSLPAKPVSGQRARRALLFPRLFPPPRTSGPQARGTELPGAGRSSRPLPPGRLPVSVPQRCPPHRHEVRGEARDLPRPCCRAVLHGPVPSEPPPCPSPTLPPVRARRCERISPRCSSTSCVPRNASFDTLCFPTEAYFYLQEKHTFHQPSLQHPDFCSHLDAIHAFLTSTYSYY